MGIAGPPLMCALLGVCRASCPSLPSFRRIWAVAPQVWMFCLVITLHALDALLTLRLAHRLLFSWYLSPVGLWYPAGSMDRCPLD
eukprot:9058306-Pyramimonas_sp.AAC.1